MARTTEKKGKEGYYGIIWQIDPQKLSMIILSWLIIQWSSTTWFKHNSTSLSREEKRGPWKWGFVAQVVMASNQNFSFLSYHNSFSAKWTHKDDDNRLCLLIKFVTKTNAPSVRIRRFFSDYFGLTTVQTIFGKLFLTYIGINNGVKSRHLFL